MPKIDGIEATMKIREDKNIPIIILSAKSEYSDKILGLNIGADDYITKPFHLAELNSRIKAVLRRGKYGGNDVITFNEISKITVSVHTEMDILCSLQNKLH